MLIKPLDEKVDAPTEEKVVDSKQKDKSKKGSTKDRIKGVRQYVTIESVNEEQMEDADILESSTSAKVCNCSCCTLMWCKTNSYYLDNNIDIIRYQVLGY